MPERILITGGAGFLGLHLSKHLAAEGADVTLIDDFSRGRRDHELFAEKNKLKVLQFDLRQPIPDRLVSGSFDAVCHLAAVVGVRESMERPDRVLRTNALTTLNLLDWCSRNPPKVVLLSSTSEVANGAVAAGHSPIPTPERVPFVISDPGLPRASYALSKMLSEMVLLHSRGPFRVRICRYHNVYGPRMGNAHVIPQFINRILDREDPFAIYGAHQSRAFCYVSDAIEATVRLMRLEDEDPVITNVGNDTETVTAVELAHMLFAIADVSPQLRLLSPPPGSPDQRQPDLTILRQRTGFVPKVPLNTGLRQTFEWHLAERSLTRNAR